MIRMMFGRVESVDWAYSKDQLLLESSTNDKRERIRLITNLLQKNCMIRSIFTDPDGPPKTMILKNVL
jgi:hypothetical protein